MGFPRFYRFMLVYGDIISAGCPYEVSGRLARGIRSAANMPAGIERHAALVGLLIECGELACGIADADFDANGEDAASAAQDAAASLLMRLAAAARTSWDTGFRRLDLPGQSAVDALLKLPLPASVTLRQAEGFAHYALFPEAFADAARHSGLPGSTLVIGIRSIGSPLAAVVASALGANLPMTVRPVGDPFNRTLRISTSARTRLRTHDGPYAVVDEGPGLSGSSFGAVLELLESEELDRSRIALFPSHPGPPGPRASVRNRAFWNNATRHLVTFEDLMIAPASRSHRLRDWAEQLIGPVEGDLEDISAGGWLRHRRANEATLPPVNAQQERRKYLLRSGGRSWLLKFAGLGREGERKAALATALDTAGFTPRVAGLIHGFLAEEWLTQAHPLDAGSRPHDLPEQVGRYLGFRARHFPAPPGRGASAAELWRMARQNITEALGTSPARRLERWSSRDLERLDERSSRVAIDGRMHAWEWLVAAGGRLIKCDALDHHCAHDLIGCQDIAWDIVGADVELGLDRADQHMMRQAFYSAAGREADSALLAFFSPCYLAFQLGSYAIARACATVEAQARLDRQVDHYASLLGRILEAPAFGEPT